MSQPETNPIDESEEKLEQDELSGTITSKSEVLFSLVPIVPSESLRAFRADKLNSYVTLATLRPLRPPTKDDFVKAISGVSEKEELPYAFQPVAEEISAALASALSELDEADIRIREHQAVTSQLREDTRRELSELGEAVKKL